MMPNEEKQRSEAERRLHALSKVEIPTALEQRVLRRIQEAELEGTGTKQQSLRNWIVPGIAACGVLALMLSGVLRRKELRGSEPHTQSAIGMNSPDLAVSQFVDSHRGASNGASDTARDELVRTGQLSLSKVITPRTLTRTVRLGTKSALNDLRAEEREAPREADTADGITLTPSPRQTSTFGSTPGGALPPVNTAEAPGRPLPKMDGASTPGEPLPRLALATVPGTPLATFAQITTNGDEP